MKKKIALLCTFACLMGTIEPTLATEYNSPTDNADVPVTFDMNSIFTVTLPENIQGKATTSVDFNYSVQGDIAANEVITVEPKDSTFTLSDTTGKTIDASVSIPKTEFSYDEIYTENVQTGSVSVSNLPAGQWEGVCNFNINLIVEDNTGAGLYNSQGKKLSSLSVEDVESDKTENIASILGYNKNDISKVVLPEGVTRIGNNTFKDFTNLSDIIISDGVNSIGENAFNFCSSLSSVSIPDSVTSIEAWAFAYTGISELSLSNNITSIGKYAFNECNSLTSVNIPNKLKAILEGTFAGCYNLESIVIPSSVVSIEPYAFYYCDMLEDATFENVEDWYVGSSAGDMSTEINSTVLSDSSIASRFLRSSYSTNYWTKKVLAPGLYDADGNMICTLTKEQVETDYPSLKPLLEVLNIDKTQITKIIIPEGATKIGDNTFSFCTNLVSVSIPNGVTDIGYSAFYNCKNLSSIVIPEGVTSIESNAFYKCTSLTSINIPEGVTYIGVNAFYYCSQLSSLVIPDSVTKIEVKAFYNVPHIYYNGTATGSPWGAKAIN